jgi:hypothetical protein
MKRPQKLLSERSKAQKADGSQGRSSTADGCSAAHNLNGWHNIAAQSLGSVQPAL